jgi:phage terminase large subunit-like protein
VQLELTESDKYTFDEVAAERPLKFCKYVRHFEDQWFGKIFDPTPEQAHHIRQIYGWKHRDSGIRRFRKVWLETAKGWGKTPFMSLLGLYEMFAAGTRGAYVVSLATVYKQALLTFDYARHAIRQDEKLSSLAKVTAKEIRVPKLGNKWEVLSGSFDGRSGFRPSLILADEIHEHPSGKLLKNAAINMPKKREPLLIMATNAGPNKHCFAWEMHEQAVRVLDGKSEVEDLYPVIHEAPPELDWTSEAAAKAANPSLGAIGNFSNLLPEIAAAKESSAAEAKYRRLYLGQWAAGSGEEKWLDMNQWDAATRPFKLSEVKDLPLYLSIDGSLNDDLTALVWIWAGPQRLYIRCHQWIPKAKAYKLQDREGIQFDEYQKAGDVTLCDSETIDHHVHRQIIHRIRKAAERFKLKCLSYDAKYMSMIVAEIERKAITPCVLVPQQAVSLHPACQELERALTAKEITIRPNGLLRAQAAEVELWSDTNGNTRPVKEGQRGKYAGTRSKKIDGIAAIVTGLTSVLRDRLADTSNIDYTGAISFAW